MAKHPTCDLCPLEENHMAWECLKQVRTVGIQLVDETAVWHCGENSRNQMATDEKMLIIAKRHQFRTLSLSPLSHLSLRYRSLNSSLGRRFGCQTHWHYPLLTAIDVASLSREVVVVRWWCKRHTGDGDLHTYIDYYSDFHSQFIHPIPWVWQSIAMACKQSMKRGTRRSHQSTTALAKSVYHYWLNPTDPRFPFPWVSLRLYWQSNSCSQPDKPVWWYRSEYLHRI